MFMFPKQTQTRIRYSSNNQQESEALYISNVATRMVSANITTNCVTRCQVLPWNNQSDRRVPHHQRPNTMERIRQRRGPVPGGCSPGGVGCDIKHNSYDRYLYKLKGTIRKL